jgi:hypothetical protein
VTEVPYSWVGKKEKFPQDVDTLLEYVEKMHNIRCDVIQRTQNAAIQKDWKIHAKMACHVLAQIKLWLDDTICVTQNLLL